MRLTVVKSEHMEDWFVIERAEHDGAEGYEQVGPNSWVLRCSSQFSDADVEGAAAEMLAIAVAIRARGRVSFKRCAVRVDGHRVFFCSPRNSREEGEVTLSEADELAALIECRCVIVAQEERHETI